METNTIIVACSIFKKEIEYLKSIGKIEIPVIYVNSMLHMEPQKLQGILDKKIDEYKDYKIVLVFGDCHARMLDYGKNKNIVRTQGINCCEIFLGSEKYREFRKEGAFILLPEWADRWKEVFIDYMGFKNSKQIKPFMNEMHKKLIFVDTGYNKVNNSLLNEISDFLGLPLEICNSSINELETVIDQLIKHLEKRG